jgi:hypothetical protein
VDVAHSRPGVVGTVGQLAYRQLHIGPLQVQDPAAAERRGGCVSASA